LGRPATPREVERAKAYTADYEAAASKTMPTAIALKTRENETPNTAPKQKPANTDNTANVANADEADQTDAPVKEDVVQARDACTAAWASFCQALFGSAEFRYVR
jgi:hypothetical protein